MRLDVANEEKRLFHRIFIMYGQRPLIDSYQAVQKLFCRCIFVLCCLADSFISSKRIANEKELTREEAKKI